MERAVSLSNNQIGCVMPELPLARILIVDDEVRQMQALCQTLGQHGYEMTGVSCGEDAIDALRNESFDLVLTDLMMPGMDGISVVRQATQLDPNIVGIVMTGAGSISTAVEAMQAGALDYILKPFKISMILPVLSRSLAVRQLRLQNAELNHSLKQRTGELEQANNQLRITIKELGAFSSSVSHDLRAPLRAIDGFSKILLDDHAPELSADARDLLSMVRSSATEMNQLINDLLRLSRVGRQPLKREKINMVELVERVIDELRGGAAGREVEFNVGELSDCYGDPGLLKQVFTNLLSNAVKFTRHRERAVIEVSCDRERNYFVRDNGAGFDVAKADKLFGDFQRFHSQREFEGTGVGLSIVRRIVERHGGRVCAESQVNQGATFYFCLPQEP